MIVLGLTGSIGMGKSTTAALFGECGAAVYDADAAVHALYQKGGAAVAPIEAVFPGTVVDGAVDRDRLRAAVIDDPDKFNTLNQIVHPLVGAANLSFREQAMAEGREVAVLDIPLLFETGGGGSCDYVCVVTAQAETQRLRVLAREGMTETAFEEILARQMPDAEKRAKADFIVFTEYGLDFARAETRAIMDQLIRLNRSGHAPEN